MLVFLIIGKFSTVFLVFLYLHDFLSGYITDFYCFGFLLFCRYQTFTKGYFIIWVLNITFTTLNFIDCPVITKINIFLISILLYIIFASIVQSDFYMVLWGVSGSCKSKIICCTNLSLHNINNLLNYHDLD